MRLIDADALLHEIEELKKSPWFNDDSYPGSHAVRKEAVEIIEDLCIKDAPTVDAVEVVRCKDCENWDGEEHWCSIRDSYGWDYKPNDFCSYGDKKGTDNE